MAAAPMFANVPAGWQLLRIGDVVEQIANRIRVEPENNYQMAGVKWYGEGVFHRETMRGKEMSASQVSPLVPGALIYNRLFAWKGSFAVVPQEVGELYVSGEFPQFFIKPDIALPQYLHLYCMSSEVNEAVNRASHGSAAVSRNRLKEEAFLNIELLLPPLDQQRAIVRRWQDAQAAAQVAQQEAAQVEQQAAREFLHGLGLAAPDEAKRRKVFAVNWREFERWGADPNIQRLFGMNLDKGEYSPVPLGSLAVLVQYGTSDKANTESSGVAVVRMNNIKNGVLELSDIKHILLAEKDVKRWKLQSGDILFNRTNSKELVGKCAVFYERAEPYVFASYLIRVQVHEDRALPEFVSYVINGPIGRQQIDAVSRQIIGQANVNSEELRDLRIPLPPLAIQQRLVQAVEAARRVAAAKRSEAEALKARARAEVEAMLLGGSA